MASSRGGGCRVAVELQSEASGLGLRLRLEYEDHCLSPEEAVTLTFSTSAKQHQAG